MDTDKRLALVTGASSGIGFALAEQLAGHGYDLLLNAEDDGTEAVARLRGTGREVTYVQADLRSPDGVRRLHQAVAEAGRPLDVAVLNAGVGSGGAFTESDLSAELDLINLNVTSTVHLARLIVPAMIERGDGRLLITSSIAATMPGPFQATYNASKSFLQSFSEALRDELRGTGVSVTALMPGPTDTPFFRRAGMETTPIGRGPKDDPRQVAAQAYDALMARKAKLIAGSPKTKAQGNLNRLLPDKVKARTHRKMAEPEPADDRPSRMPPG